MSKADPELTYLNVRCKCSHTRFYHYGANDIDSDPKGLPSCSRCKRCKGFRPTRKLAKDGTDCNIKPILSVALSDETNDKFRNFVSLKHGLKKGGLSFEVERALRQYMGEKDLDVFITDNEWKQHNK